MQPGPVRHPVALPVQLRRRTRQLMTPLPAARRNPPAQGAHRPKSPPRARGSAAGRRAPGATVLLAYVTSNTYATHAAGLLAPVAAAALLTAAVPLPVAHTALTALSLRLRERPTGGRGTVA
ncbi:hypothetical protein ACWGDT_36730 [Streptomyces avermitilis]